MVSSPIGGVLGGVVIRVNSSGFMLDGRETWENISKYAHPKPAVPPSGARVRCTLDRSGYVRAVEQVNASPAYSGGYNAVAGAQQSATASTEPPRSDSAGRDLRIVRMNAITNATAILSSGGQVADIGQVLEHAATLEAWVLR
jgi:hypothetical protein